MNEQKPGNGNFMAGFFIGGIIGAGLIFLLGTKEGKKVADKLVKKAEEAEDEIEEKVKNLKKQGEHFIEEAQAVKDQVKEQVEKDKKVLSEKLIASVDETLTKIEDIQTKGVELTRDVHRSFFRKNGKKLG